MSESGVVVVEVQPDKVNTTQTWNNTMGDTREDGGHLGSLPLPIAVLLNVTFGRSQFFLLVQGDHGGQRLGLALLLHVYPILFGLFSIGRKWQSSYAWLMSFKNKVIKT